MREARKTTLSAYYSKIQAKMLRKVAERLLAECFSSTLVFFEVLLGHSRMYRSSFSRRG
jgi:hypothetical protein